MTLLYSPQITAEFFRAYGPAIDSVVFAFDDSTVHDTQWGETIRRQRPSRVLELERTQPLLLMTYANWLSSARLRPAPATSTRSTRPPSGMSGTAVWRDSSPMAGRWVGEQHTRPNGTRGLASDG